MNFRYTMNELQKKGHPDYLNDAKLLLAIVNERTSTLKNYYTPLAKRLKEIKQKLETKIEQEIAILD